MVHTYTQRGNLSHQAARFLRRALKAQHCTQENFAEKINCDVRTVRRWLKDGVQSLDNIQLICDALDVSVGDIFLDEEDVPSLYKGI